MTNIAQVAEKSCLSKSDTRLTLRHLFKLQPHLCIMFVNLISITGTYAAQTLAASGVILKGDLTFSYQHQTKTLIYKGSNTWKVVG